MRGRGKEEREEGECEEREVVLLWDISGSSFDDPLRGQRFRSAQIARNRRITKWARQRLAAIEAELPDGQALSGRDGWRRMQRDEGFVVQCTMADPWRIDTTVDPSDREVTSLDTLARENHSPVGLARFCTLRSAFFHARVLFRGICARAMFLCRYM